MHYSYSNACVIVGKKVSSVRSGTVEIDEALCWSRPLDRKIMMVTHIYLLLTSTGLPEKGGEKEEAHLGRPPEVQDSNTALVTSMY